MSELIRTCRIAAALAGTLLLTACGTRDPLLASYPERIDFNQHIRPILSDNCFRCHGPDPGSREAGLRLDLAESALAELPETKGKHAIVPGDPDSSELVRRVTSQDEDVRMPPPETHRVLTDVQVALLKEWIDEGAEYKPHWAFIAPQKPEVPDADFDGRAVNEIDRFVSARLQQEEMQPAQEADKAALMARVSLTLTGLPPSLAEVDAFQASKDPRAYEKIVEGLLASPDYAEHMATFWLDLARWSESDGFLDDHHDRLLWPWRDWVIKALNENMPFDKFATWQLAGDLMPKATREQRLATAFLRLGKRSTENGIIDEEYRVEYAVERADTVGNTFMGLTVGCARCHDHKYDPISQKAYYSLTGFFNSTDEPGYYPPGHSGIQAGPTLPWTNPETEQKIAAAGAEMGAREKQYAQTWQSALAKAQNEARERADKIDREVAASIERATVAHYPFETTAPIPPAQLPALRIPSRRPPVELVELDRAEAFQRLFAADASADVVLYKTDVPVGYVREQMVFSPSGMPGQAPAVLQAPILKQGIKGKALYFDEGNKGFLGKGVGYYERTQPFTVDLWFFPAQKYEDTVPVINHRDDDNSGGAGYRLELQDERLQFYMAHSRPFNMIALSSVDPLPLQQWAHITITYDGSSHASGVKLYVNGKEAATKVVRDNLTRTMLPYVSAPLFDNYVGMAFGSRFREKSPVGSALDEVRVFNRALVPLEVRYLHDPAKALAKDAGTLTEDFATVLATNRSEVREAALAMERAREAHNKIVSIVPQILVMGDTPTPRPTYLLDRGVYSERRDEVPVQALDQVYPWDAKLPPNRVGLAEWIFDPKNPLTARVFVNRIWQMHFGTGLVDTSEDFGMQGSLPTHPELLDWLAVRFVESGWDIKQLHKLIVMSATFRQGSQATEELLQRDPENRLLARGVRRRMSAEMVRDQALAAAGLLKQKIGGPSVHPYQPEGIWNPLNSFYAYPDSAKVPDDEHHRRSVYTFVKRSAPHPGMHNFDFADRNVSTARRRMSNTPLQALELMNDPQFIEAYRSIAAEAMRTGSEPQAQLTTIFRLARREQPTDEHLQVLRDYYGKQTQRFAGDPAAAEELLKTGAVPVDKQLDRTQLAALTNVTAVVMNSPDAYFIR